MPADKGYCGRADLISTRPVHAESSGSTAAKSRPLFPILRTLADITVELGAALKQSIEAN
jgi:hypothetical protein